MIRPCARMSTLMSLIPAFLLGGCYMNAEKADRPAETSAARPAPVNGASRQSASGLHFTAPPEWISEPPSSGMRQAQYRLPRTEGDPEDAELVVFFFRGEGGTVQANIDRWVGQFQKPDGSPANGAVSNRKSGSIPLTIVDVSGVYNGGGGMMQESKPQPGFRMLAAVAETSSGPWFFKLTGPAKTVAKWQASFQSFLDTIR